MSLFNLTMTPKDIVIIGAGSFGLACAASAHLAGHNVRVVASHEATAASVAAGMIAPAMETAIDDLSPQMAAMLKRSRDLWTAFAAALDIDLQLMPAQWRGVGAGQLAARMAAQGFAHVLDGDVLTTQADAKLDPVAALEAMQAGIERITARVSGLAREDGRWVIHTDGPRLSADDVVLATGAARSMAGLPSMASAAVDGLIPIRGLIGITKTRLVDHVVRGPGAYIAPVNAGPFTGGSVIGATMEEGVRDLTPDPVRCQALLDAALRILAIDKADFSIEWRAGIRAASPDGLPLAGALGDGLHMALGPRRNGWLLAPLVAAQVLAGIEGQPLLEPALDPMRLA